MPDKEPVYTRTFYQEQTDPPSTKEGFNTGLARFLGSSARIESIDHDENGAITGFLYRAWRNLTPEMIYDVKYTFSKNTPPSSTPAPEIVTEESEYTHVASQVDEGQGNWIMDPSNRKRYWVVNNQILNTEDLLEAKATGIDSLPAAGDQVPPDDPTKPDGWHWIGTRHAYYRDGRFIQWAAEVEIPPPPSLMAANVAEATPRTLPTDPNILGTGVNMMNELETVYNTEYQRYYTRRVLDKTFVEWL